MKRWLIAIIAATTLTSGIALSGSREPVEQVPTPHQSAACSYRSQSIAVPVGDGIYEITLAERSGSISIVLKKL